MIKLFFLKLKGTYKISITHQPKRNGCDPHTTNKINKRKIYIHNIFKDPKEHTKVCKSTERECSCRRRFADQRRCLSQALQSRESIVERTDGSSGRRKIMIKACGINVQGTLPRACHIVLPRTRCTESQCDE